ncbi:hypothetical protein GJ496_003411 [Pomphorhynchus laevis]|nr:hypothetical protein GJ496_003411 [Pomphorhynchus laevis]
MAQSDRRLSFQGDVMFIETRCKNSRDLCDRIKRRRNKLRDCHRTNYTRLELGTNCFLGSCWTSVEGNIFDLSEYLRTLNLSKAATVVLKYGGKEIDHHICLKDLDLNAKVGYLLNDRDLINVYFTSKIFDEVIVKGTFTEPLFEIILRYQDRYENLDLSAYAFYYLKNKLDIYKSLDHNQVPRKMNIFIIMLLEEDWII